MLEPIETARLRIRDVDASDVDAFFAYMRRDDYWCNLPFCPPTRDSVQSHIDRSLHEQSESLRKSYFLAATLKDTGQLIGEAVLGITSLRDGQAAIGWAVDGRYTGRGFATEIGRAMLDLGFGLGLHRIYAQCRAGNAASLRIMSKLAMTEEGTLRENVKARGEWWSSSQWSILSSEHQ
jgi:RimJ/RimL family protein N-acetyltransferase